MRDTIYLDHNATSPLKPEVCRALKSYVTDLGNPSSPHTLGRRVRADVETARERVADLAGARPSSVIFNSGGTEGNNQALRALQASSIIISTIEHDSIIGAAYAAGVPVHEVPVTTEGGVDLDALAAIIPKAAKPALVSIMMANNETGVIQPYKKIIEIARKFQTIIHCDAVQALGKIPLNFSDLDIDLMTLSAHKISGLSGTGALVFRQGLNLSPLLYGGGQERGYRSGTENVIGILAFGAAAQQAKKDFANNSTIEELRDHMEIQIKSLAPQTKFFGQNSPRLPNTTSIHMPGVKSDIQIINFDLNNIYVSSGSACSSGKIKTSHVLRAMGISKEEADCTIRVSMGWNTTQNHINNFIIAWSNLYHQLASTNGSTL